MKSRLFLVLLLAFVQSVNGFPTGAGGSCPPNSPAVGGPHVNNSGGVSEVSFEQASYSFLVNGNEVLSNGASNIQLVRGETYTITVATNGDPFRGALIRVEGSGVLDADENSILAGVCEKGVTHSDSSLKRRLSGSYFVPTDAMEAEVAFDVTVVEVNNANDGSVYAYQRVVLPVVDPFVAQPPTEVPITGSPIQAPTTAQPVVSPSVRPTLSPVQTPTTFQPVVSPTSRPFTGSPIQAPTSSPLMAPVEIAPVPTPVAVLPLPLPPIQEAPTSGPISMSSGSPVSGLISVPVSPPVALVVGPPVAAPVPAPSLPVDLLPTIPIAWLPTTQAPVEPTTLAPFPTIPIAWLPTTSSPVKMPSMLDLPTIPIAWQPPTTESSEIAIANITNGDGNSTELVLNVTDIGEFNDTNDMMQHDTTEMDGSDSYAENLQSASVSSMSWFVHLPAICFAATVSLLF